MSTQHDEASKRRLAANRLSPRCGGGVADVVRAVCGIQAQDATAARLSVRARSCGLVANDVDACEEVVRTWAWRGTLHLLAKEDVPWVLSLVAARAHAAVAARWRALGLDDAVYDRARAVIVDALPATRAELRAALEAAGIDASGQRLPHLTRRVALEGLLHHPLDGTFAPLSLPAPAVDPLAELGRRYATAYGPSTADDLAVWSGLPLRSCRAAWVPATSTAAGEGVRLLPAFDTFLLGYASRPVAPEFTRRVWPGGGWIHPTVLVHGRVAGTWNRALEVDAWDDVPAEPLAEELEDVRRFLS